MLGNFQKQVILDCSIEAGILLTYAITLYVLLRSIKISRFRTKYAYPKTILLYSLYDLFFLMFMGMIFWTSGVLTMASNKVILAMLLSLLFVFILGVFTSRWFLTLKIRLSHQANKYNQYLPIALAISSTLPSLGVLAATINSHSLQGSSSGFVYQIAGIAMGSLLVYLSMLGYCEIFIIGLRKWPQIKRANSNFIADWENV
jgi:hypothetical protein